MRKFIWLCVIFWPSLAWAQTCPAGTVPLPWGVTRDQATDQIRQIFCQDSNGRIYSSTVTDRLVRNCASYDVGDAAAKILACVAALPATGGIADARGLDGAQTFGSNFLAGLTKPVTFLLGAGTYTTVPLELPASSAPPGLVRIIGAGLGQTILIPSAANQALIRGTTTPGLASDSDYFADFSVKAHAAGSTGPAIDMTGFRGTAFERIGYLSNGAANSNSFFHFAASPSKCYNNSIIRPRVADQTGPATVFLFDNNGAGASGNANLQDIEVPWIYNNTGITTVIDARRSSAVSIRGGDVEDNPGATVLIPGETTRMEGVFLENNAANAIVGTNGADGSSFDVLLLGNTAPIAQTWSIAAGQTGWLVLNNYGPVTVTNNSGNPYNLVQNGSVLNLLFARDLILPNDTTSTLGYMQAGDDPTLGPLGLNFLLHPSAIGANRYAAFIAGDSLAYRNLSFFPSGGAHVCIGNTACDEALHVTGNVKSEAQIFTGLTFATLGAPANGKVVYCSDCTIANPCAGAGTGAVAKRLNGVWVCN